MSKTYIRFGDIPKDGISKVHRSDEIICNEKGLSVWNTMYANDVAFPVIPDNPSEACIADYFYWKEKSFLKKVMMENLY